MQKRWIAATALAVCFTMAACQDPVTSTPAPTTTPATTQSTTAAPTLPPPTTTTIPTVPTVPPTTVPATTAPVVLTGWQNLDGRTYYFLANGTAATGWITVDQNRYFMADDGVMVTGWLVRSEGIYFLGSDGKMVTGWMELGGKQYCFSQGGTAYTGWYTDENGICRYFAADGAMTVGWLEIQGSRYYFDAQGSRYTGWLELDGQRYLLSENGKMVTGWVDYEGSARYLRADGAMARGCVQIDGINHFFTSTGEEILVANPWNYIPQDYDPDLVALGRYANYDDMYLSRVCYDALMQMLKDCESQASRAVIVSAYRTQEFQTKNYQRKVQYYRDLGYSQARAEELAAKVVAVPGTSEHQLGLAVDLVDVKYPYLDDDQATTKAQKWLMEHCWEYGFILRYPADKTDETGIIYEPWHYRYVGKELAAELHSLGVTLEAYLADLTTP